ncbi:ABC transporter substrate-binding protein [Natrarchaeobius halalkaliphilus]|uniref:ABC transporter substrate-binding protein n=1 Tax=Natrarchaeobius halalkaliphilus TaxID=1679091 RepID=A0A3N6LIU8_9EURY|nr:ABC transporter substrate-binding protein [Natrarchaeobius halalkaliphilus]RQG87906.1 ABC transporter substrate-binding protein [Natrarchaeobius halalkaliphilus]
MVAYPNRRTVLKSTVGAGLVGVAGCLGDENGETDDGETDDGTSDDDGGATDDGTGDEGDVAFPDEIQIGVPSPTEPVYAFPIYGDFQSQLDEHGTSLERTMFNGFTPMVAALMSGEIDFGYLTVEGIVGAINEGFPIVAFSGFLDEYVFVMIASPEIDTWEDLEGGRAATHSPNSMSTVVGEVMIDEELGSDAVDLINILGATDRLAALEADEVDAAIVPYSAALNAEDEGIGSILAAPWEYEKLQSNLASAWITLEDTYDENTDLYRTMADELSVSYEATYDGDLSEVTEQALAGGGEVFPDYGQDIWEQSLETVREIDVWPRDGDIPTENLERSQDLLVETGILEEDDRIDDGFIRI